MTKDVQEERIRVHVTVAPNSPAYVLLKACKTAAERRKTVTSLMQVAAAAVNAGVANLSFPVLAGALGRQEKAQQKASPKQSSSKARALDYTAASVAAVDDVLDF